MRTVIAMYVENKYGVLTRVAALFMRRGFNIDSLTVGETDDPSISRMTITTHGDAAIREQIVKQLTKLHEVRQVKLLDKESSVEREIMLLKVRNRPEIRSEVMAAAEVYRARIIDYTTESLCMEVTGEPSKIEAFIDVMKPLGIVEMCRTGVVALERGAAMMEKQ